jgi:hypothetical protein
VVDPFLHNRVFFFRIRAAAYARMRERFSQARAVFPKEGPPGREFLRAVEAFLIELEATREYAVDAVRGLKRLRVQRFRHDRSHGILEEEIVLLHFLEERTTHARFLCMRVETDLKIRRYRDRIRRLKVQRSEGRAPLEKVLESFSGLMEEEVQDLGRILEGTERRFKMGDRLMEILGNKMPVPGLAGLETHSVLN